MLINLLPHREFPLAPARARWWRELGLWLMGGVLVGLGWSSAGWLLARLNQPSQTHGAPVTPQAVQTLTAHHQQLRAELAQLQARIEERAHLQAQTTQAASMLHAWAAALPEGVVVQSLKQEAPSSAVLLQGLAPDHEAVTQWLSNLSAPSGTAALHGELIELRSSTWPWGRSQMPVQHFSVRITPQP